MPLTIETVEAGDLQPDDALIRIHAASICHTDLEALEGELTCPVPMVLGHEAAGVVEKLGEGASGLAVGDRVILHWNPHCGHCFYCDRAVPIVLPRMTTTFSPFSRDNRYAPANTERSPCS